MAAIQTDWRLDIMGYSHRDIIRHYADTLRSGASDQDLSPRQRRLTAVILATASNDGAADQPYPLSDDVRAAVLRRTFDALWNGNVSAFFDVLGGAATKDYGIALERAATILRNI